MKKFSKLLCCLMVVLFCVSMMACSREVIEESWVYTSGDTSQGSELQGSDVGPGDTSDGDQSGNSQSDKTNNNSNKNNSNNSNKNSSNNSNKNSSNNSSEPTTKNIRTRKNNNTVFRNITVAKGSTKLESTYANTFKGKTYRSIIWTEISTESYKAELDAFAKQYGCTINKNEVNFEQVRPTVATALSSGKSYDIIRMHGSWYPRVLISNLLESLDSTFTTADCTTPNSTTGIDLDKSKYFAWNNHLYAVTTYDDSPIYYLYYNKRFLSGANDPWNLYKQGQWTWAKMKELAAGFTGTGGNPYWSDQTMMYKCLVMSNNVQLIKENKLSDGNVKLEASISSNAPFINALRYAQGLKGIGAGGTGIYEKKNVLKSDGASDKLENILNGNIVVWASESNRYQSLYKRIAKEGSGFNKSVSNLGVAPFPLGPDNNAKAYPAGWLTAFSAGRGSDATAPKLVAALCKFHSTYDSTAAASAADKAAAEAAAVVAQQMSGFYAKLNYCDFGYGSADETMDNVLFSIESAVAQGADITSTLKKFDSAAAGHLKNSLDYQ